MEEDHKFDTISGYFDRMKKVFQIHQETLSDIDQKLNQLIKRRQDREKAGVPFLKKMQEYNHAKKAEEVLRINLEAEKKE